MKLFSIAFQRVALLLVLLSPRLGKGQEVVQSIRAAEMDWAEGRLSIEAELQASGYQIERKQSDAVEPDQVLDELKGVPLIEQGWAASVTVLRLGRTGIAYVWLPQRGQIFRVTAPFDPAAQASHVLSLRVVELIALQGQGYQGEAQLSPSERTPPKNPSNSTSTPTPSSPDPVPTAPPPWSIALGYGISLDFSLKSPSHGLDLSLERRIFPHVYLGVVARKSFAPGTARFDEGRVRVSEQGGAFRALAQLPWGRVVALSLGPSVGVNCLRFSPEANDGFSTTERKACTFVPSAFLRVGAALGRLSLWTAAEPGLYLPQIRVLSGDTPLTNLGRPWLHITGGLSWAF